ncbi:MAG: hypothetical protein AAF546_11540 [Verrucomicrobiota bacterium]
MKQSLIIAALFSPFVGLALTATEQREEMEFVHVLGSVDQPGQAKYQDGMNLYEAVKELKPTRLWNGYVTIKDAKTKNHLSYRFRPTDGDSLEEAMKRVVISRGDTILFHENST